MTEPTAVEVEMRKRLWLHTLLSPIVVLGCMLVGFAAASMAKLRGVDLDVLVLAFFDIRWSAIE